LRDAITEQRLDSFVKSFYEQRGGTQVI